MWMGRCRLPRTKITPGKAPTTGGKTFLKNATPSDAASSFLPPFPSSVAPLIATLKSDPTKTGFEKLSNRIFSPKKCQETQVTHLFPLKKHPGTPKNRNFHDPFLDEPLRYLASACRNDLFFSSASSSA